MSIHFAPQWVKPIKPSGSTTVTATTPTTDVPPSIQQKLPSVPFPALAAQNQRSVSPNTSTNPPLSYSRVTHAPLSPGLPTDSSYFPYGDSPNGNGNGHPFRYTREQILGLYDEEKVKERPIELVQMAEDGVLVSKNVAKPVGLRDLSEIEKRLFATSIHPPVPTRRQATHNGEGHNAVPIRRTIAPPKDIAGQANGRGAFGGFGRGEGGAFGGGKGGVGADGKMPGSLGGGFGGVGTGKRIGRRADGTEPEPPRASAAPSWRQPTRTASGTFEGVLAFGNTPAPSQPAGPTSPTSPIAPTGDASSRWREKFPDSTAVKSDTPAPKEPEPIAFGNGGGPGWGVGQRKWRTAAAESGKEVIKTLDIPISSSESVTDSVIAAPSETSQPERDEAVNGSNVESEPEKDLSVVQWFYRDPNGLEQGPFAASQMHDWYTHSYFTDDLPVRRDHETTFHTLSELKVATANAVQPFLSPLRPRNLPPNLPIPLSALQGLPVDPHMGMNDSFRNLGIQPSPQQFLPDRNNFSPNQFAPSPYSPAGGFPPAPGPGPWNGMGPGIPRAIGNYGLPSPIGSTPLPFQPQPMYSPVIGGPILRPNEMFQQGDAGPWSAAQPNQRFYQPPPQPQVQPPPQQAWQTDPSLAYQTPQPHVPASAPEPQAAEPPVEEPSYFPPIEAVPEKVEEAVIESQPEPVAEMAVEAEETPVEEPVASKPAPASVWGQKATKTPTSSAPPSRKSSILPPVTETPTPATTATPATAPTTSSASKHPLPAKPLTRKSSILDSGLPQTPEKSKSAVAPWATKEEDKSRVTPTGPSLREIQETEAKQADARKAALAEARQSAPSPVATPSEDFPSSMAWGLPSSGTKNVATPKEVNSSGPSTPSAPVWGGGETAPKKTLKQIQEEEEKRKLKAAAVVKAQQVANGAAALSQKRGYADLAATATPPAGWSTVGPSGKATPTTPLAAPTSRAPIPAKPTAPLARPLSTAATAVPTVPTPTKPQSTKSLEDIQPSSDFIRWTKQSLNGLTGVNMDEFIQMLLTFPINPPASQKAETLQIISESVYENSSTLDGRRFAQEFYERRRSDALARVNGVPGGGGTTVKSSSAVGKTSLADVVKTVPKPTADLGFKIVKAKGKKKQ